MGRSFFAAARHEGLTPPFIRRVPPAYRNTIMYTSFESKTPIERPYLLKSLFATGVVR